MHLRKRTPREIAAAAVCACVAAMMCLLRVDEINEIENNFSTGKRTLQLRTSDGTQSSYHQHRVFYNLFVASPDDIHPVNGIFLEQFEQVAIMMNKTINDLDSVSVDITNIGFPLDVNGLYESVSLPSTSNVDVTTEHIDSGDEKQTLIKLWDHCQNHPDEGSIVTYLNSKGSFHASPQNDLLRSFVTRGATSKECIGAVLNNAGDTCDVCSSRFSPLPHPHTSGNMWTARCSYVSQLPDPRTFEDEMNKFHNHIEGPKKFKEPVIGAGRFVYEHWVHCHPSVKPCDVYAHPTFAKGNPSPGQVPSKDDPFIMDLQPAPRFPYQAYARKAGPDASLQLGLGEYKQFHEKKRDESLQLRLREYKQFYDATPPREWYGWAFHGRRRALKKNLLQLVSHTTETKLANNVAMKRRSLLVD